MTFAGKLVCITGASGGIGRALAEAFAAEGARLLLVAHRRAAALDDWRDRARVAAADVRDPDALDAAMAGERIDVCVANAGIFPDDDVGLHAMSEARVREVIDTNLLGTLWTARAFLKNLAAHPGRDAALVLIGSTSARFGERGHAEYSTSKAGLYGLLRSLKNEIVDLDPTGRVNLVEPGWTMTPMARRSIDEGAINRALRTMPLRRVAAPEDVAAAVTFLASPAARHVTGEILTVAGGMEGRVRWE
ncbi:MAG TPA: SDR family oxidoreductase [Haliangiales bacterium]|nr:SDR family oxidoreductase [Haliangiales bacterium]